MRIVFPVAVALMFATTGCLPWIGTMYPMLGTYGTTSQGLLQGGETLERQGSHYRLYHGSTRAYAIPQLTRALVRAADKVAKEHADAMLLVGDMSAKTGGFIPGHRSHRSGRDADLAFFTTDLWENPIEGAPLVRFDRFGVGLSGNQVRRFDTARNWALIEALLNDEEIEVQWIFVSTGLKALLLEWALQHNRDIVTIERAASVLRQPGDSAPHDDHFHVRVYCPKDRSGSLCIDTKPIWPWIEPAPLPFPLSKEALLQAALEGLE